MAKYITATKEDEQLIHDCLLDFIKRISTTNSKTPEEVEILPEMLEIFSVCFYV